VSAPIHHVFVRAVGCAVHVELNGFPVVDLEPTGPVRSTATPINPLLIGAGNRLTVTLSPLAPHERAPFAEAQLDGEIRRFAGDAPLAQLKDGHGVLAFGVGPELRERAVRDAIELPLCLTTFVFDSEGPSFRHRFAEGPTAAQRDVLAYAMKLRQLFADQDRAGIAHAMAPKMADYAAAYGGDAAEIERELYEHLDGRLFSRGLLLDFTADDVVATPFCDGRLWRLERKPRHAFVQTREDAEGLDCKMDVFVGVVDGGLRIVR
jgi:hypothetical protein